MGPKIATATDVARLASQASHQMRVASTEAKNSALLGIVSELEARRSEVEAANIVDKKRSKAQGLPAAMRSRLDLEGDKFNTLLAGLRDVVKVDDPVGLVSLHSVIDDGLELYRVSCPIGVLCIIFESRPEAVIQISSLAIKSGNAVILKGGKEASESNKVLVQACRAGLKSAGLPADAVQLVSTREDISELLKLVNLIDLVIPRGGKKLIESVMNNTRIPVLGHADGICTIYVDKHADLEKAVKLVIDSKTQYVAACNTAETLLIHETCVEIMLPVIAKALGDAGVKMHVEEKLLPFVPERMSDIAKEEDFRTEFLALEISIKSVPNVSAAINHINCFGSHHTDSIVTEDGESAELFLDGVSSACVFHNASTRFADGHRFGFGAEVGVSTNRIHARGPVGLEGLLIYKYRLHGSGQCVAEYSAGKRTYKHKPIALRDDSVHVPNMGKPTDKVSMFTLTTSQTNIGIGIAIVASSLLLVRHLLKSER